MRSDYQDWLTAQKYEPGTITAQLHRAGRVEKRYGDLDEHFDRDRLQEVLNSLSYSTNDERMAKPNPSKIPFEGDARKNLASYKDAARRYVRFRDAIGGTEDLVSGIRDKAAQAAFDVSEELGERFGLERDMQATLRKHISQLDSELEIIDDGSERSVESGFIDITARDRSGSLVVIELKAGCAGQRAVAQILSYMGDLAVEEPGASIRGMLVAADFDGKARAAARMVPSLALHTYSVRFSFTEAE